MPDICTNPLLKGRNKKVYIINQHGINPFTEKILVTMIPTAGFTVGFNLTFTGSVYIDFKDGLGMEALTSGIEKTHLYSGAGTYIAEITGDLINITKFIADNNRITNITGLKTGLLTDLQIQQNLYSGLLDLSLARVSGSLLLYSNPGMNALNLANAGNGKLNNVDIHGIGITTFDLKDATIGSNINNFYTYSCPNLENIIFASSGNTPFKRMNMGISKLGYVDFTSLSFALNAILFYINNNSMTAAEINHILVDIYSLVSGEGAGGDYTGRLIDASGSNAAPDSSSGGYDGLTAKANLISKGFTVTTN